MDAEKDPTPTRPPGGKRLRVILAVCIYVILGIPVWWITTSLHRPALSHADMQSILAEVQDSRRLLPVSLEVYVVLPGGAPANDDVPVGAAAYPGTEYVSGVESTVAAAAAASGVSQQWLLGLVQSLSSTGLQELLQQGGLQLTVTLEDSGTNSCHTSTASTSTPPLLATAAQGRGEAAVGSSRSSSRGDGCLQLAQLPSCTALHTSATAAARGSGGSGPAAAAEPAAVGSAGGDGGVSAESIAEATRRDSDGAGAGAAAAGAPSELGSADVDGAAQMDAALLQLLQQHGKAALGHHVFFLLPEGITVQGGKLCTSSSSGDREDGGTVAAGAGGGGGPGGTSSSGPSSVLKGLTLGEHHHGWAYYTAPTNASALDQQVDQQKHQQQDGGSSSSEGGSMGSSSSWLVSLSAAAAAAAGELLHRYLTLHINITTVLNAAAQLPVSPAGQLVLSFNLLNSDPRAALYDWDFSGFEEKFLHPLVRVLAPVVQVSVESQVLLYTRAAVNGTWSKRHRGYVVPHDQLPFFVDSEWPIESSGAVTRSYETVGAEGGIGINQFQYNHHPQQQKQQWQLQQGSAGDSAASAAAVLPHVLHFVVYVPPADQQPLLLLEQDGQPSSTNSFWIPSWGGLAVLNPGEEGAEGAAAAAAKAASSPSAAAERAAEEGADGAAAAAAKAGSSPSAAGEGAAEERADGAAAAAAKAASSPSAAEEGAAEEGAEGSAAAKRAGAAAVVAASGGVGVGLLSGRKLSSRQEQQVAAILAAQLHKLMGLPLFEYADEGEHDESAWQVLPSLQSGFSQWEVAALVRQQVAGQLTESARVLSSLSRLVQELPNLEMPDVIGEQVSAALAALRSALAEISAGNYLAAAAAARAARAAAESAFLHPAVLAQLNFPESHKLGVYMPLFLPVTVPLLQGLVTELARYIKRRRAWLRVSSA